MNLVLTDTFLLFYKDAKAFSNLQAGASHKPDQVMLSSYAFVYILSFKFNDSLCV